MPTPCGELADLCTLVRTTDVAEAQGRYLRGYRASSQRYPPPHEPCLRLEAASGRPSFRAQVVGGKALDIEHIHTPRRGGDFPGREWRSQASALPNHMRLVCEDGSPHPTAQFRAR